MTARFALAALCLLALQGCMAAGLAAGAGGAAFASAKAPGKSPDDVHTSVQNPRKHPGDIDPMGHREVYQSAGGIIFRTYTAPVPDVRAATIAALDRMELWVTAEGETKLGWQIAAKAPRRKIDILLVWLSPSTTRMQVTVDDGSLYYDVATELEIARNTSAAMQSAEKPSSSAGL